MLSYAMLSSNMLIISDALQFCDVGCRMSDVGCRMSDAVHSLLYIMFVTHRSLLYVHQLL